MAFSPLPKVFYTKYSIYSYLHKIVLFLSWLFTIFCFPSFLVVVLSGTKTHGHITQQFPFEVSTVRVLVSSELGLFLEGVGEWAGASHLCFPSKPTLHFHLRGESQ